METFTDLRYFDGERFVPGRIVVHEGAVVVADADVAVHGTPQDLAGAYVAPAFNDCHCHVSMLAESFSMEDVGPDVCPTLADALTKLRAFAAEHPYRTWIVGHGFAHAAIPEKRYPTREELDAVAPGRPVYVWHASRHGIIANSKTLQIAGVDRHTPDPEGGRIERDDTGRPTGALSENAIALVRRHTPQPTKEELADNLMSAAQQLNHMGITAATDAASFRFGVEDEIWAYGRAAEKGMPLRVRLTGLYDILRRRGRIPTRADFDPWPDHPTLALGGVKLFADGAIGTRTAAVEGAFIGGGSGLLIHDEEELALRVTDIHLSGRQAIIHAIGDRAVKAALDAIAAAQETHPRFECRHRIDHSMLLTPDLIGRYARAEVVAAMQPEFLLRFGEDYVAALGDRAMTIKPFRSLLDAGVSVGFSSDLTIVPGRPGDGMLAAVTRRTAQGLQFDPAESLAPVEALRAYTEGSAYAGFQEGRLGRIAPGYRADFALFPDDPLEALASGEAPAPIATVFDGRIVWTAD